MQAKSDFEACFLASCKSRHEPSRAPAKLRISSALSFINQWKGSILFSPFCIFGVQKWLPIFSTISSHLPTWLQTSPGNKGMPKNLDRPECVRYSWTITIIILWVHQGISLNQSEPYGNQTDTVSRFCRFQGAGSKTNTGRLDAILLVGIPCMKEIDLDLWPLK